MDVKSVFRELQEKKITPEEAKKRIEEIKKEKVRNIPNIEDDKEKIAIIGMSGHYPKSKNLKEYWSNLEKGVDTIQEVPKSRWNMNEYFDAEVGKEGKIYCKWMGMLDDIELFDASFFEITPSEAEAMDPQHRLFLEESYKAFEDAGYSRKNLNNENCGVYYGVVDNEYTHLNGNTSSTGGSNAIGASRIAYYLNLKGPAIAINTACSSSMVGIHLAVQALKLKEINMALVGGACLYLTPETYISMCETGMLSPEGKCKTFDNSADGFVPGEGVGALVLKRLSDAEKDGDHIYGLIIASGVNQDGKTNGITAPNLGSQNELEKSLYKKNKINPESISYAEFHGTGTKLGDPIELEAMALAFREYTSKKNYCAIGSVKSNLGHTSAAGGIAGIQKILLCMQNKKLVPTINIKKPNEQFDFKNSPFYINTQVKEWKSPNGAPLRACINSFGFSGTNVHLVLEEYKEKEKENKFAKKSKNIFVLSAKNNTQLRCYIKEILEFLDENKVIEDNFFYTLQESRDAMEDRIALIVDGIEDLKEKLKAYLAEKEEISGLYENHLKRNIIKLKEASYLMDKNINDNNLKINDDLYYIAEKWIQGEIINWKQLLYENMDVCKISLPVYPFEKQSFWKSKKNNQNKYKKIHPLIDRNISDFTKQCFQSNFRQDNTIIAHHKVGNQLLLPGAAILEMAREAAVLSSGNDVKALKDIQWTSPIVISEDGKIVKTELIQNGVEAQFYIMEDEACCAHGTIVFETDVNKKNNEKYFNINETINRLTNTIERIEFYNRVSEGGISYGESFQVVDKIYYDNGEALSHFTQREFLNSDEYIINPNCLDGAMQIVSTLINNENAKTYLPFLMEELLIYNSLPVSGYAYAVENKKSKEEKGEIRKFNILIIDEFGKICIELKGINLKRLEDEKKEIMLYLNPKWVKKPTNEVKVIEDDVILFSDNKNLEKEMKDLDSHSCFKNIIWVNEGKTFKKESDNNYEVNLTELESYFALFEDLKNRDIAPKKIIVHNLNKIKNLNIDEKIKYSFEMMFLLTKALISHNFHNKVKLLYLIDNKDKENIAEKALSGMFRDINTENINFSFNTVCFDEINDIVKLKQQLINELSADDISSEIYYKDGERFVQRFSEIKIDNNEEIPVKNDGVYLITGGVGGLGFITAKYLVSLKKVKLILTGRNDLSKEKEEKINELSKNGSEVIYLKSDITNKKDVKELIDLIKNKYRKINGVIHAAGIKKDKLLYGKTLEETRSVIDAKVLGTTYLDEAIDKEHIDFMVFYSSVASVLGNIGQCDYCYANSFMDNFALCRNELVEKGKRYGKTISINWPFWENGGMKLEKEYKEWTEKENGSIPISNEEGMMAWKTAVNTGITSFIVLKGKESKLRSVFLFKESDNRSIKEEPKVINYENIEASTLEKNTINYLKKEISKVTKIQEEKIDEEESFGDYGIDSITILKLTRDMEKIFGELSKTLFFEYNTVKELAIYFINEYRSVLIDMFVDEKECIETTTKKYEDNISLLKAENVIHKNKNNLEDTEDDIAIIGISCKYPMANNLDEYWYNLKNGVDCITEIPKERWDYMKYYDEDRHKNGAVYSKWGGFINDVDKFDTLFFNISPIEAEFMDPQVRLFLESVWNAMEDAGYTRESLKEDNVGVFVGVMYGMYQLFEGKIKDAIVPASASYSAIANRVSYFFDFKGPSLAVDSMCSSSLTALHLACNSLKYGESSVAFVGGVNLSIHPKKYQILSFGQFLSTDGKCRSFGEGGDGYVPGEGVGTVVLKPLKKAQQDKDHIYAVIKGSAINCGGKTSGATVPSPIAQSKVISSVYEKTGIDTDSVNYIETHGTGTSLGDPIEINGLNKVFNNDAREKRSCSIGSVKSNIGHLEGAAGIASLTKVVLQMQHKELVPSLHSKNLNPNIKFENTPFYVQQTLQHWDRVKVNIPRRAGINSFGAGGANAHVLVEEYENTLDRKIDTSKERQIYLFSAKNKERLKEYIRIFVDKFKLKVSNNDIEKIKELFATELGIDERQIDVNVDIQEYGIDIEHCISFLNWLLQEKEVEISIDKLKSLNTINKLAQYVSENNKSRYNEDILNEEEIAYTLQVGREAMEERIAIIAESLNELCVKLCKWLDGEDSILGFYEGNLIDHKQNIEEEKDKILAEYTLEKLLKEKKYEKLAELWTIGLKIDWLAMYENHRPFKVSLPGYSFVKEHYWVKEVQKESNEKVRYIHPMLHENISDITGLKFRTHFSGNEDFLMGHIVEGQKILPGVAYFEIIHAAVNSVISKNKNEISIHDLTWIKPAIVKSNGLTLYTNIKVKDKNMLKIIICSDEKMKEINCEAYVNLNEQVYNKSVKLIEKKEQCNKNKLVREKIYNYFDKTNIKYGSLFKNINTLYIGDETVVAKLKYSGSTLSEMLSIGLMDSALQSAIGFDFTKVNNKKESLALPFAVEKVEISAPCKEKMWAVLTRVVEFNNGIEHKKVNIKICDEEGRVCINIKNLIYYSKKNGNKKNKYNIILFNTVWKEKNLKEDRRL